MFGIAILIIFGSKLELWQDQRERHFGKRYSDNGRIMMGDMPKDSRSKVYNKSSAPAVTNKGGLTHVDNTYGSKINLTPTARVSFQKTTTTNNGDPIANNQSSAAIEPWNPSTWIALSTDDNTLQPIPRANSLTPNVNNISSINAQREFYNREVLDAVPSSSLKSPTLNHTSDSATSNRGSSISSDNSRGRDE